MKSDIKLALDINATCMETIKQGILDVIEGHIRHTLTNYYEPAEEVIEGIKRHDGEVLITVCDSFVKVWSVDYEYDIPFEALGNPDYYNRLKRTPPAPKEKAQSNNPFPFDIPTTEQINEMAAELSKELGIDLPMIQQILPGFGNPLDPVNDQFKDLLNPSPASKKGKQMISDSLAQIIDILKPALKHDMSTTVDKLIRKGNNPLIP